MKIPMEVAKEVAKSRNEKQWSQTQLVKEVGKGMNQNTISRLENGKGVGERDVRLILKKLDRMDLFPQIESATAGRTATTARRSLRSVRTGTITKNVPANAGLPAANGHGLVIELADTAFGFAETLRKYTPEERQQIMHISDRLLQIMA